jgi:flagellar hook-associated protein 3 FlgL
LVRNLAQSANVDQFTSNVTTLSAKMQTADSAISTMVTALQSAITIGTAGANGINTAGQRQGDADQIASILAGVVAQANTKFEGVYIFGGSANQTPPLSPVSTTVDSTATGLAASTPLTPGSTMTIKDSSTGQTFTFNAAAGNTVQDLENAVASAASTGVLSAGTTATINSSGQLEIGTNNATAGVVASSNDPVFGAMNAVPGTTVPNAYVYVGNSTVNQVQVGDSLSVATNLPGSQFLTSGASVITALSNLITELQSGTTTTIGNAVNAINTALNNLDTVRVPIGNTINRLSAQENFLSKENVNLKSQQSSLVGMDMAEAATNLSNAQMSNSAVLAAAAKALPQTLLDYLR